MSVLSPQRTCLQVHAGLTDLQGCSEDDLEGLRAVQVPAMSLQQQACALPDWNLHDLHQGKNWLPVACRPEAAA